MKLFNKTIDRQLFKQYSLGSDLSKQEVVAKIFNPYGNGRWYIINSDPNDPDYLWAIVDLGYGAEVGSVSRKDLETYRGRFGLGFERDLGFDPINAEELYNELRNGKYYEKGGEVSFIDYKGSEIMYEPNYNKYYANDVEFDSLQEAKEFIDSGKVDSKIQDAYSKGIFSNGGSINQEYLIKNISFEDQTDIADGEYSFSFELFDKNGSSVNDYEGTITETSRGIELDWEVSGVLDEWWEQAEKIIIDAFTEYKFNNYANGGNVIDAFQIRTVRGQGDAPTEILTTDQEVKFKKGGKVSEKSNYIPTYEVLKVHTKDGKVFENIYTETAVISGIYVSDKPLREKNPVGKNQIELFKKGGIPKSAIYIPRYNVDFIETENNGNIQGNYIYGGVWVDMKKQFRLVEEAKEKGTFNRKNKISKFEAIYNDKKISIEAENLLQAKTKAIAQLKVPKTKVGLLSVYNVEDPMVDVFDNGGAISDSDKETLIYVNQILRRAVINGDLTVDEANSGLAFEIAEEEVEYFIDDDMQEMGSSDFGYMYRNFINSYNEVKAKSFATGGGVGNDITNELQNFDIENLDPFETMQYNQFYPSLGKVGALQVLIDNVEGDYSQLSEELAELAEKQMSMDDWNEATREMMFERDGYATGGGVGDKQVWEMSRKEYERIRIKEEQLLSHAKRMKYQYTNLEQAKSKGATKSEIEKWKEFVNFTKKYDTTFTYESMIKYYLNQGKPLSKEVFKSLPDLKNRLLKSIEVGEFTQRIKDGKITKENAIKLIENANVQVPDSIKNYKKAETKKSPKELRNEYLYDLAQKEADVWEKIGAESGSEIRNSDKMLKAYAEGVEEMLQKEGVGKGSFDQEDYDYFTDENWHLFNEFLVWNSYYEPEMTKTEKAWREKRYADPKYKNYVSNPKVISLSGNSKPKSSKYILNADIKQVKVKTDEGYEYTFKGTDVLNGVNILEKGSLLKNDATYVAKRNIIYVELKNGEKVKPANGYWIKKDAKGELFKPESKEEYKVLSNQAIFPKKGVKTYWYVENSKGQTINNTTGKPYKGKEMTNYYFLNEDSAKKFAEKLNSGAFFMAGGKTTFKQKSTAIAKKFEGKKVEPKYQKEYGKTYDKAEAKEVGNKIAGSQKAKYDSKMSGGGSVVNLDGRYIHITYEGQPLEWGETQKIVSHKYSDSKFDKKTLTLNFKDGSNLVLEKQINDFEKGKEVMVKSGDEYVAIELLKDKTKATKMSGGGSTKRGGAMQLAKQIRKEGESWQSALKRANEQIRKK